MFPDSPLYPQGLFLYLATLSAVAYYIWAQLLKYNPVGKVSVYGFMNPVCGVILSALLLQEGSHIWGFYGIAALVLVCLGIYLSSIERIEHWIPTTVHRANHYDHF